MRDACVLLTFHASRFIWREVPLGVHIDAPALPKPLASGNRQAILELTRYLIGRAREESGDTWPSHLEDYAGVGLDGFHVFFVRYLSPVGVFDVSPALPLSEAEYQVSIPCRRTKLCGVK